MSFTSFADRPLRSREQVAREVHAVSLRRGLDELATVIALMTISTEAGAEDRNGNWQWWCPANPTNDPATLGFPHDSTSDDSRSSGYFQQQPGPNGEAWWGTTQQRMTLAEAADMFLDRLSDDYTQAAGNPALAGQFAQHVQGSSFPDRYAGKWDEAWAVLRQALAAAPSPVPAPTASAPQFTVKDVIGSADYSIWQNSQTRSGREVDLLVGHTTEGAGGESLVRFMEGAEVSYHVLIDNDADGNTVWNLVDKSRASWSVLDANGRSINYVIGRSKAAWTRQQWIDNARNAVRIMAYLMVQDAKARDIPIRVQSPPYSDDPPALTDHAYVTRWLGIGTHTDLGPDFIWDLFTQDVTQFATGTEGFLMALNDQQQGRLLDAAEKILGTWASRSIYRDSDAVVDDTVGMVLNIDGSAHELRVENSALLGDPEAIELVQRTADGKAVEQHPDAIARAAFVLSKCPQAKA